MVHVDKDKQSYVQTAIAGHELWYFMFIAGHEIKNPFEHIRINEGISNKYVDFSDWKVQVTVLLNNTELESLW